MAREGKRRVEETGSDKVWDAHRLRIASNAAGVALWSWNVDTDEIAMDDRAHLLWGVPRGDDPITFEDLSARIHPADLDRVRTAFEATRQVLGSYDIDFRIENGDDFRWVSARGQGDDRGIVGRLMLGVFLDVTERRRAEETRELLAVEMTHRVKNLLAVASALASIAARSSTTTDGMERDLKQRLLALGLAHDLVRPDAGQQVGAPIMLCDLIGVLLRPYAGAAAPGARILVIGPEIAGGETSTSAVALVVHELATNSLKYGSLSVFDGSVEVSSALVGTQLSIRWTERGGPPTLAPTEPPGFGTRTSA